RVPRGSSVAIRTTPDRETGHLSRKPPEASSMGRVARQRIEQSHSRRAARKLEANTTSPTHRRCPLLPRLAPPILPLDHNGSWRRDARTQPAARRFPIHRATALEANSPAGGLAAWLPAAACGAR